jgi:hypothetical protein
MSSAAYRISERVMSEGKSHWGEDITAGDMKKFRWSSRRSSSGNSMRAAHRSRVKRTARVRLPFCVTLMTDS